MTTAPITQSTVDLATRPIPRAHHRYQLHDDLVAASNRVGPVDHLPIAEILELFPSLRVWSEISQPGRWRRFNGARRVLEWLRTHPGDGWQQRWLTSGADTGIDWVDPLIADVPLAYDSKREQVMTGVGFLLICRVVLPSYTFLHSYKVSDSLSRYIRQTLRPDLFTAIDQKATALNIGGRRLDDADNIICKMVLHTGRDVDRLTAEDFFAYRAWAARNREAGGGAKPADLAWALLRGIADLGEHASLRDAVRLGQRPTGELVDAYNLRCRPIRDVLVRYLDERRPSMDYSSLTQLISVLVGNFWADIEYHHTGIDTLHLPEDIADAWKQRLRLVSDKDHTTRPRKNYLPILRLVRSFYLDIQDWAAEDPSWTAWAVPSPVRRGETDGHGKAKQRTTAQMHQRARDRLPNLPTLVDSVERHRTNQATLLTIAMATATGQTFTHDEREFRRITPKSHLTNTNQHRDLLTVLAEDLATGEQLDLSYSEDEAFWEWAIVETLRHTGVRAEELTEITHLALVSYRLPDTGEIVPMLQIVPSKSNEERLLLVSPELASVLATIITRLRAHHDGTIALTTRYDYHDRITGPPLPHLFQRRRGWQWQVISRTTIHKLLGQALARAGLHDATGQPLRYTPHDFRRIFATEAVTGGLPIHIVARLLGHTNINTTQAYTAIFDDDLVRAHRAFLDKRRAIRPEAEYREPTTQEWREFQQHFQTRKLELGECARPYGTPCKHEHACFSELRLADTTSIDCRPSMAGRTRCQWHEDAVVDVDHSGRWVPVQQLIVNKTRRMNVVHGNGAVPSRWSSADEQ
ncbi:MAG: tyrosine-type recombinase/integrase [Pseudonocardiaceae bacterium]